MTDLTPTIVFLHGFLESSEVWADFLHDFPANYQVLCPDLPGYGPDATPPTDYSLEAAAEFVQHYLADRHVHRVLLVGHSMGGFVALAFAEKYPGQVAGLCLFHSSASAEKEEDYERHQRNRDFLQQHGVVAYAEEFLKPQFSPSHRESMTNQVALLQRLAAAVPLETALGGIDALTRRPERYDVLRKATYPVLFIAGKDDKAVPVEKTHQESLLADHSTVLWLANVGHVGFLERPADTRRAIEGFARLAF